MFQYYCLDYLWQDIKKVVDNDISVLNIATEPVIFSDVLKMFDNVEINSDKKPHYENMLSNYGHLWGSNNSYLYNRKEVLNDLERFINEYE